MPEPLPALIQTMLNPAWYPHPVSSCKLIETHISWVILTGDYAYKIKKPLNLGFLDFSTLEKRRHCCEEELRLNRRLAPLLYLGVLPIGGSGTTVRYGEEPAREYAVQMRQFDNGCLLDRLADEGRLDGAMVDAIALKIATFHRQITDNPCPEGLGTPARIWAPMAENFSQIAAQPQAASLAPRLARLQQWSENQYQRLEPLLAMRRAQDHVRECHGDMHLGNMAWIDGEALIFDGIEFSPALRWIDVISEVAFAVMDLHQHRRVDLAWRLLNGWLEASGDYTALALLPFYLVYRAMVRAKIAAIRLGQLADKAEQDAAREELEHYLALAEGFTRDQRPRLLICHGLSGSGKTTLGTQLLERLGAVRLRSDVERKRLFGLDGQTRGNAALYRPEANTRTYQRLAGLAGLLLDEGYTVLVDATFLNAGERQRFRELARVRCCAFYILDFQASTATLRRRLTGRHGDASDADEQVLERQLANWQPLPPGEQHEVLTIDTETDNPLAAVLSRLSTTSAQSDAGTDG